MADKQPRESLSKEDIQRQVLSEIDDAERHVGNKISDVRMKNWDRYYGKKLGNEVDGRSKFISRDVLDTIEWMMPYFIQMFLAGESKVKIHIENSRKKQQVEQQLQQVQQQLQQIQQQAQQQGQQAQQQNPRLQQAVQMLQQTQQQLQSQLHQLDSEKIGEALRKKIDQDLDKSEPGRFTMFYQWFKDALVSNTAMVKSFWFTDVERKRETFEGIGQRELQQLQQAPDVEIIDGEITQEVPHLRMNVTVEVIRTRSNEFRAEGVPHWEFLTPDKSAHMNDEHGKGQKTRVSIDYLRRVNRAHKGETGESYFQHLRELEEGAVSDSGEEGHIGIQTTSVDAEEENYEGPSGSWETPESGPKRMVDLYEWYTRLDVDGNGFLEDIVVWIADKKLIRWEHNEEGFIPFSAISPILDCYKFFGISWAELVTDIQNLKTMIFRRTLDNFDFTNTGRWRVSNNANVDIQHLMKNSPGEVIRGESDEVEDLSPRPMDSQTPIALLQVTDTMKEERSGVSKISQGKMEQGGQRQQGTMPDRGIQRLMTASQQRLDLIARIFAETGLQDFYRKAAILYQKHMEEPFTVSIDGQDMQITPDMIRGKVRTSTQMAVETAAGQKDAQKIQEIVGFMMNLGQQFPALIGPAKVHNAAQQYVAALGQNPESFLPSQQEFLQEHQKMAQQQQKQQQLQMQMQQQQMQLEKMDRQIKQADLQQKTQEGKAKIEQKEAESKREALVDERDSIRDYMISAAQLLKDEKQDEAEKMLEQARFRQEQLNARVGRETSGETKQAQKAS